MSERRDYAIGPAPVGYGGMLHRIDCDKVRAQAERGELVVTMFDCAGEPDPHLVRCSCLEDEQ